MPTPAFLFASFDIITHSSYDMDSPKIQKITIITALKDVFFRNEKKKNFTLTIFPFVSISISFIRLRSHFVIIHVDKSVEEFVYERMRQQDAMNSNGGILHRRMKKKEENNNNSIRVDKTYNWNEPLRLCELS